jgi:hypothetical protein
MFLLDYVSNVALRHEITAITNIVEMYNAFLDWVFFGKLGAITENDPIEQEKRLKYLDLVASAVILQNTVDMSLAIQTLMSQGELIPMRHLAAMSPYITRHIKRYGDYVVNLPTSAQIRQTCRTDRSRQNVDISGDRAGRGVDRNRTADRTPSAHHYRLFGLSNTSDTVSCCQRKIFILFLQIIIFRNTLIYLRTFS